MDEKVKWLRISYWATAIADFIVVVLVLIPGINGVTEYVYPMGLMSAVAFSWGVLLIYADRRPVERRWILLPTMLVVAIIAVVGLHAGISGLLPLIQIIPSTCASVVLFSILLYSHLKFRGLTAG